MRVRPDKVHASICVLKRRSILSYSLTAVLLLLALAACGPQEPTPGADVSERGYVLPELEVPEGALVTYEAMVTKTLDRTLNWRYYIDEHGCYYAARNRELQLATFDELNSSDPALVWDTPFSPSPDRCLSDVQLIELKDAILLANLSELEPVYTSVSFPFTDSPWVERWTFVEQNGPVTIVVEQDVAPLRLKDMQTLISRLVAEAPSPALP